MAEMKYDKIQIPAVIDNLNQVIAFIDDHLEKFGCPMKSQMQIDVAVEEIFVNIAHYAYQHETGEAEISIGFEKEPPSVIIEFRDSGKEFNPLAKADPDITLSASDRSLGGLGIYMVKKTMDQLIYERENSHNILRIIKKF